MREHLFSYGTLQNESVQRALFGRVLEGTADVLKGYRIESIEINDEAFLSQGESKFQSTVVKSTDPNDSIGGTAFKITEEELHAADRYEPANYKRIRVTLGSGNEAWIYVAAETH